MRWAERLQLDNVGLVAVPCVVLLEDLHAQRVELLLDLDGVDVLGVLATREVDLALDEIAPSSFSDIPGFFDSHLNFFLESLDDHTPLHVKFVLEEHEDIVTTFGALVASLEQLAHLRFDLSVSELVDQVTLGVEHGLVLTIPPVTLNSLVEYSELLP